MQKPILIWDIDGTLSDSSGAGIAALSKAIEIHFDGPSPELNLAGATDGGIYRHMCNLFQKDFVEDEQQAFFNLYLPYLKDNLSSGKYEANLYATVSETLEYFKKKGFTQGLLTGNIEHGAYLKNERHDIQDYFGFGAYGCDHHDRNELGFVAAKRASEYLKEKVEPTDLLIIGDTLKDIACARACGAKVAAVTTGHANRKTLKEADWVIDHVKELTAIVENW